MLGGPHDRQPADDRRMVAPLQFVLKDKCRLTVGNPVGERGNREFGEVELVLPPLIGQRQILVNRLKPSRLFDRQIRQIQLFRSKRHDRHPVLRILMIIHLKNNNKTRFRALLSY